MFLMTIGFQKLLRRWRISCEPARLTPATELSPATSPAGLVPGGVLPACLAMARQRFEGPSDPPCRSLFVAADLTAAHLSPQECVSLLLETRDDIRALVYQRFGWFRPFDTRAHALTHTLGCVASMIIEYHLRENDDLVRIEHEHYGQVPWPSPYADPGFGFPGAQALNEPKA